MGTEFDTFFNAYVEAALWSSPGDDGEPLDDTFGPEDFSDDAMARILTDCKAFFEAHRDAIASDFTLAGHDFWLTRNGHGVGFWDGDWPEPIGDTLTAACEAFGQVDIYEGDDGALHLI
jgi:hypothetical protein